MSAELPKVPPRPSRTQERASDPVMDAPIIPPRPQRRNERSVSPMRGEYTRSPLNDMPANAPSANGKIYNHRNLSAQDLPPRPPSVNLPSIGQEGSEYANLQEEEQAAAEQHRNISPDLPMHAPTASVPQSTAKSRIQTVTRTDSNQAASHGIGSPGAGIHPLRAKASFNRSNLSLSQEPTEEDEHGIPEIGIQVPMLKFAGDVQAPTPAPSKSGTPSISFNDATPRNHHRKRSSRQEFHGPPGSYGLHGHRHDPKDQFEKAWYAKHPEELVKEHRPYDPGHAPGDWALSSDDLNKLVHQNSGRGLGMGSSPAAIGTPDESIGFMASEAYTSRMNSPKPLSGLSKRPSSGAQPAIESPLSKESFGQKELALNDNALESEVEDETIHIDPPAHRHSKIHGGGYDPPTVDLGPEGGNTSERGGWVIENGDGMPILASDEVAKNNPEAVYWQPAVSPQKERKGNDYYDAYASDSSATGPSRRRSGEKLRTSSGGDLARFKSREAQPSGAGTPLEEIEEYEPLFPDDDDKPQPPLTVADKLKRPDLARHHFPSQDIWEDVPESLQYETEVSGPQEPEDLTTSATFEHPDKEQARKEGNNPEDRADFLTQEAKRMAKTGFKPGVAEDMARPSYKNRFPSRDVWEDSPDSLQLETTVDTPQMEDEDETGPADIKSPIVPQRPARSSKLSEVSTAVPEETTKPQIPARPAGHQAPVIPERPKPQVPARPARGETAQTQDSASTERAVSPPAVKAKPAVPARPAGNKFAALKAGFLENLNARLGSGPPAPPKHEEPAEAPVEEKAPLADARKGRARGPARRKPAAEAAAAAPAVTSSSASTLSIGTTFTIFQINDQGNLSVPADQLSPALAKGAQEMETVAAANTDGAAPAFSASASTSIPEDEKTALSGLPAQAIGHIGDTPDPKLSQATMERASAIQSEFEAALADSEKHGEQPVDSQTDIIPHMNDRTSEVPIPGQTALPEPRELQETQGDVEKSEKTTSASKSEGTTTTKKSEESLVSKIGQTVNNAVDYVSESVAETVQGNSTSTGQETSESKEVTEQEAKPQMTDTSVQTGQQDITIRSPTGEEEKMTLHLGGRAAKEGNVVVKNGEEIVGDMDEKRRTATTTFGHGM
ncbi:hypothetical protein E4T42_01733 [Aureobasidium subglaciale]|nr:hypothetical protein E4T42_01733 [Aureobasidium subglaciale]